MTVSPFVIASTTRQAIFFLGPALRMDRHVATLLAMDRDRAARETICTKQIIFNK
ncbi:MAG: hypothetical protein AVDCRST_MAG91-3778 [uncultured Sphingomonadaceae bacterium]|uniref:Uncharacterized protein n=1 Tax=uncultured Sphingomonadaceae bacterium TaxID=169976 RepID=A0A6J4U6P9_9SPHN|nr:MAG: hypothetical protein AVDCRST_MAG91-3778 [uncultured Sphingomonadaceae bacterium]